jgi:hypothetical protein
MTMVQIGALLWLIGIAVAMWWSWLVWRFVKEIPLELRRIAAALESGLELQRRQADRLAVEADKAETGEGSSDTLPRKVSQIESYGDLSKVGMLKNRKG